SELTSRDPVPSLRPLLNLALLESSLGSPGLSSIRAGPRRVTEIQGPEPPAGRCALSHHLPRSPVPLDPISCTVPARFQLEIPIGPRSDPLHRSVLPLREHADHGLVSQAQA